jgi:tetratricopeptide (TPR) repeat protein
MKWSQDMRSAFLCIPFLAVSLLAQDPAPKPADKPAEQPEPQKEKNPLHGSATGHPTPQVDPKLLRPSKDKAPTAQNYPTQYLLYVAEAMKSFQARDFQGALAYVEKADALVPPTVWTLNVRGAVAIEQLKFEEGMKLCFQALKMEPDFFPAKFNLCEIPFLQKKYADARAGWTNLYNRMAPDDPTGELLIYRIFLTYLLEKDMDHAKEWLDKLPFPSQTPAYQYAHAAWERQQGNMKKWEEWIQSAEFIWPQVKRANFVDVLLQLKWLESSEFGK